jgi:hypothetical protein
MTIKDCVNRVKSAMQAVETQKARDSQYFKETSIEVAEAWKDLHLSKLEIKIKDSSFVASEQGLIVNKHTGLLDSETIDLICKKIIEYLLGIEDLYKKQLKG